MLWLKWSVQLDLSLLDQVKAVRVRHAEEQRLRFKRWRTGVVQGRSEQLSGRRKNQHSATQAQDFVQVPWQASATELGTQIDHDVAVPSGPVSPEQPQRIHILHLVLLIRLRLAQRLHIANLSAVHLVLSNQRSPPPPRPAQLVLHAQ